MRRPQSCRGVLHAPGAQVPRHDGAMPASWSRGSEQPSEDAFLCWPCLDQHIPWHSPGRVRRASAITMTSSRGPMIGRNSGMRSIGDSSQSPAIATATLALVGTRGSPRRRRTVVRQAGSTVARSLAAPGGNRFAANANSAHDNKRKTAPTAATRRTCSTATGPAMTGSGSPELAADDPDSSPLRGSTQGVPCPPSQRPASALRPER